MELHHIGYAVRDIEQARSIFTGLGYQPENAPCRDERRRVAIQFLKNGAARIELIAPLDEAGPVSRFLEKNKGGPYHFCYQVGNLDQAIDELQRQGYALVEKPSPAVALENHPVAFLHQRDIGLVELVEIK